MTETEIRHEGMRIGGQVVYTEETVLVHYPYTNAIVDTFRLELPNTRDKLFGSQQTTSHP